MTPEGKIKKKVTEMLKAFGVDCWRFMPVQTGYGSPALDYLICFIGVFVVIETKKKGGKLTPLQESTKAAMEAAGALVMVVEDDYSLYAALRCLLMLEEELNEFSSLVRRLRTAHHDHTNIAKAKDEGVCAEYVRQFVQSKEAA